jgi:predicted O-linked N-acetylglucosamine transferase (SPINDLY family)
MGRRYNRRAMSSFIKRFRTKARELQESLEQKHGIAPKTPRQVPDLTPPAAPAAQLPLLAAKPAPFEFPESGPASELLREANQARAEGRTEQAESSYRQALIMNPSLFGALLGLGMVLLDSARSVEAFDLFRESHNMRPDRIDPLFFMGVCHIERGDVTSAIDCWRECLKVEPDFIPAIERLMPWLAQRDPAEGERLVRAGIAKSPAKAELFIVLGIILEQLDRPDEAIDAYDTCVALEPEFLNAHQRRCQLLNNRGYADRAAAACEAFLRLAPGLALPHYEAARVAMLRSDFETAIREADQAAAIDGSDADSLYVAGYACLQLGRQGDALARFSAAKEADPEHARAAWAYALCQIPAVYASGDDPAQMIANFTRELEALDDWFVGERIALGPSVIGSVQAFYLAYQERDNLELLRRYGDLCCRLMKAWQEKTEVKPLPRRNQGRVRIGIVSHFLHNHSVWHALTKGWLQQIDSARFEVHLFALGPGFDEETKTAIALSASLTQKELDVAGWCQAIQSKQLEAIIYTDIGMGFMSLLLAGVRLAPVQIASWGHPETTGMSTIDYYLSADGLEPPDAGSYYSEQLIRLPNLGCRYPRLNISPAKARMDEWRIKTDRAVLLCPGVPFKYAPQHDHVFIEICQRLKRCQLVFFTHGTNNCNGRKLHTRLRDRFTEAGLDIDEYVVTAPWLERGDFHGLMEASTLFLDTIGFSGFNTAMQAIESSLPIVTCEGRFMRGRLASGILRRIGLDHLVVQDKKAYVDTVVKLVEDLALREAMTAKIRAARDILFDDPEPVRALEVFLEQATRGAPLD